MTRLPLETQRLYAELLEQLTPLEAQRATSHLPGWAKRIREALSSPTSPHKILFDRTKAFLKG